MAGFVDLMQFSYGDACLAISLDLLPGELKLLLSGSVRIRRTSAKNAGNETT